MRDVFIQKGFAGASLDELAEAAGVNRPSLYAAFGDKEALYIHTLRHYGQHGVAGIEAIFGKKGPIERRLGEVFKGAIALYTAPPVPRGCMIVGTATVEAPTRPRIAAAAAELLQQTEKAFERAFARAVEDGELTPSPTPAARARMAGAALDTLAIRARLGTTATELQAFADSMIPVISR
ncbi:MAG TPA: TetR/AcrR family transcriptional regulator [Reyranella sp.]|nr:TetR/AcrR family transcriptional regulator [Reyranella sp.]